MNKENNIDLILNELLKKGSKIDYLKNLRKQSLDVIKKYNDFDICLSSIAKQIKEQTEIFLNQKNIYDINYVSGVSCLIYLPSFENNGEYKLKIIGGKTGRSKSLKVDENTLFDIDSITKLYTLLLLFNLEKEGLINLDIKLKDLNPDFKNLQEYTLNDLISLDGHFKIINESLTEDELYKRLKNIYFSSNEREDKYSYFVISDTIEKVISKKLGKELTFEDIMYEYLLNPLNLFQTKFNPSNKNISGNGNKKGFVYDDTARILGGAIGNAGLFVTSEDLAKLSKQLYKVNHYNRGFIRKIQLDSIGNNKINEFSNGSFLYSGNTGSIAIFDPNNFIHQSILVNSIYKDEDKSKIENDKPIGYDKIFNEYYKQIVKNTMFMFVVKEYYNKYCGVKEDIKVTKYI